MLLIAHFLGYLYAVRSEKSYLHYLKLLLRRIKSPWCPFRWLKLLLEK